MKRIINLAFFIGTLLLILSMTQNKKAEIQEIKSVELQAIKSVLQEQQTCWNKGDIKGFMLGYWQSDSLEFTSNNGTTKGWQKTLERYQKAYPDKVSMGKLKFELGEINFKNDRVATLNGKWELIRQKDTPKGGFILNFHKIDGQWLIIKDYTTSE